MKKEHIFRFLIYILGLIFLAFGLTLNTTTALGVSAIISVSHTLSAIFDIKIGDTTLALYVLFVIIEIVIHFILSKKGKCTFKKQAVLDILQLPLSLAFTRVMNLFSSILPSLTELDGLMGSIYMRFLILLVAILFTGIGAAMSMDMRIIPNPGDGIVQAFSDISALDVGLSKNIIDLINIIVSIALSLSVLGQLSSVGIGTILAVVLVGRVIYVFNRLFLPSLKKVAGM